MLSRVMGIPLVEAMASAAMLLRCDDFLLANFGRVFVKKLFAHKTAAPAQEPESNSSPIVV